MRLIAIAGGAAFLALFIFSVRGGAGQSHGTAGVDSSTASQIADQIETTIPSVSGGVLGAVTGPVGPNLAGGIETMRPAVIGRSSVNFGPAPDLANGGAPNPEAETMRSSLSTPAHQLVSVLSPRWARAAQVSADNGDSAAHEFALGMLARFGEMSMEVGLSLDSVEQLHLSSSQHFEDVLGGEVEIVSGLPVRD